MTLGFGLGHLAPRVHKHLIVRVSLALVDHRVIATLPSPEDGFLTQDDQDGTRQRESDGTPAPVGADVNGKGHEKDHEGDREPGRGGDRRRAGVRLGLGLDLYSLF